MGDLGYSKHAFRVNGETYYPGNTSVKIYRAKS